MSTLNDLVSDFLTQSKIRFKTHKIRNAFVSDIISLIKAEVSKNGSTIITDAQKESVHEIVPGKKARFETIMTKSLSEKGDDLNKEFNANKKIR